MKTLVRALVPKRLRSAFRRPYNYVRDKLFLIKLFGHYASMIPPLKLMYDGPVGFEEFKTNGEEFFRYYTELCDLKPYERMLDVGSGIGRKTFLLTDYLNDEGSYEGLDIVKTGIDWCTERITRKYPASNFSSLMSATSTTIPPEGTKPPNIDFLSRTSLLILPCSAQCSLTW